MRPQGIFNARKCASYLRSIGVELLPATVSGWLTQERNYRTERRQVQRTEAYECRNCAARWEVTFKRRGKDKKCPECGATPNQMWLLEIVRGNGDTTDYRENAARWGYDGPRGPQPEPWRSGDPS